MVHPNQQTAAQNIRHVFLEKKIRYAILMARCQAGKTGSFQELIRIMLASGDIQRAYILCGSNEVELREQATVDTRATNRVALEKGDIKVIFRQDFHKSKMDVTNALIIVDESHLDQTHNQELDIFLNDHGLGMDGNPTTLEKANAYIVSVDATPYSELAALAHKETPFQKHVETLIPGKGYFGLAEYKFLGMMHPTFDISQNLIKFANLLKSHKSSPKWALVRLTNGKKSERQEKAIKTVAKIYGFKVLYNTTSSSEGKLLLRILPALLLSTP